ncbi:acyl carrier protein [Mucilaginibacter lutimaris]|uniref:Acyl carrier protein n=1 Tax=Mucilaginibacter lutimaris TaxID=931629 RepID=A0ABW2ZH53_9SPHI
MNIETFIQEFAEQFDEIPADRFAADTLFKENEEWSSMTALSVIAMVDQNYSVRLTGDDVRKSSTVEDIYNIVATKLNA